MTSVIELDPAFDLTGPIDLPSAATAVADHLRRAVHMGAYADGDRLPAERRLAEMFQVSRVTVRAALHVLHGEGLIRSTRGSRGGAVVLAPAVPRPVLEAQRAAARRDADDLMDFRRAVEPAAAAAAAKLRTTAQLDALLRTIEQMREAANVEAHPADLSGFRRSDSIFHLTIADASGNPWLRDAIQHSRAAMFQFVDLLDLEGVIHSAAGHTQILAALRERDALAARAAMLDHLGVALDEIHEVLGRHA